MADEMKNMAKAIFMHPEISSIRIMCEEDRTAELVKELLSRNTLKKIVLCTKSEIIADRIKNISRKNKNKDILIMENAESSECEALYFDSMADYIELKEYSRCTRFLFGDIRGDQLSYFDIWEDFRDVCSSIYIRHVSCKGKVEILRWKPNLKGIELSIVFPVYKVAEYLDQCIQSVLQWEAPYIEFLFINDGSPDNSAEIIQNYMKRDKRIKLIDKENGGCASARKKGLACAAGRYVGFIDPDDFIDPTMFRKLFARALMGNYQITYCGYNYFYESSGNTEQADDPIGGVYAEGTAVLNEIQDLVIYSRVAIWRAIYNREFLESRNISFNENLRRFDDLPFKVETFMKAASVAAVPEHLYFYRMGRPGQDVSCDDERLYTHFDIFEHLDQIVLETGNQKLIDYLQVVKVQTHIFGLERIQKTYRRTYIKKARKDINRNCSLIRTAALVRQHAGRRALLVLGCIMTASPMVFRIGQYASRREKERKRPNTAVLSGLRKLYDPLCRLELPGAFFEAEVREGYFITEKMKKVWAVELDLLNQLLAVCQKNNLNIFADGGTLLGAVRHHGFIPWDDDIDMVMFREDYDKLVEISEQVFPKPYFLQTAYSDVDYMRGHAQLRNSNTTGMIKTEQNEKYNLGIFIDIFVLDGVPQDPKVFEQEIKQINCLKKCMWNKIHHKQVEKDPQMQIPTEVLEKHTVKDYYGYSEEILRSYPIAECTSVATLNYKTESVILDKSIYNSMIWMDFEGMKVPAPAGYDQYLKEHYGMDYMVPKQLPTEHGEMIFEPDIPYAVYLEKLKNYNTQKI